MSNSETNNDDTDTSPENLAAWKPLPTTERRVFGVLVEKAKTTPDAYPLTLNAITTGSNQKSNRSPLMSLEPIDVENSLEVLRHQGAVSEVHGSGRMSKYRHRIYEWLGVDKVEAAVMTELLLRGEQTIGELRGRAARMEPIADVAALKPILKNLQEKGLVQALTPEGRGQIVTHCLYLPEQQEKLERTHSGGGGAIGVGSTPESHQTAAAINTPESRTSNTLVETSSSGSAPVGTSSEGNHDEEIEALQSEIEDLKETVADLEKRLELLEQLIN